VNTLNGQKNISLKDEVNIKEASLLVYGLCSNAGDVLIEDAFNALFKKNINTSYHHIRLDKLINTKQNIILGPGGILSGSYNQSVKPDELVVRHMTEAKVQEWVQEKKNVFIFGSGTNTPFIQTDNAKPFSNNSKKIMSELFSLSKGIYLRGKSDILKLQSLADTKDIEKMKFQPCPSIFLDRIHNIKPAVSDRVAINFPFLKTLTEKNYKTHPINRFIKYIRANGLKAVFVPNHTMDVNRFVVEIFDEVSISESYLDFLGESSELDYEKGQKLMTDEWKSYNNIAERFNGYRFAFGTRLHSFLPFMAFNIPSLFLAASPIRAPLPLDYFSNKAFCAKEGYTNKNVDSMVDGMIERLNYFIKHEDQLKIEIAEDKKKLYSITEQNMFELLSEME